MSKGTEVFLLTIAMKANMTRAEFLAEAGRNEEAQALLNKVFDQLSRLEQLGEIDVTDNFFPTDDADEDPPLFI
jgi:hypothetical protein